MSGRRRRLFRIAAFRGDGERDLDDELAFHFSRTVEALVARGWEEEEAWQEARRRFGDEARYRRELERIDGGRTRMTGTASWWGDRWADLRSSLRGLVRRPGFSTAVVITFALGIGANAALFGIVDRLLLSPPAHVVDPGAVVRLAVRLSFVGRTVVNESFAWEDFGDLQGMQGFAAVAAYSPESLTLGEGEGAQRISAMYAGHELFPLLGVRARLGRFYGPDDDRFDAPLTLVLGYDLWRSRFGGAREALGATVRIAGAPYTVVGVAPPGFTGVGLSAVDAWLPIRPAGMATGAGGVLFSNRGYNWVEIVARMAPGASLEASLARATSLHRSGHRQRIAEGAYDPGATVVARPVLSRAAPDAAPEGRVALWLAGVSIVVLLVACANVANLLVARGIRQHRESAVRLALGISPVRLVGQRVMDALVLALVGGGAGLAVAVWGGGVLRERLLPEVDWAGASAERTLGFTVAVTLLAGLVAAAAPATLAARQRFTSVLSHGVRASGGGNPVRRALALGQASLTAVLLVGAGLFVRSMTLARESDLGFDADHILAVELEPSSELKGSEARDHYRRAVERVSALPGVRRAAATNSPFGWSFGAALRAEGLDSVPMPPTGGPYYHRVTDGYFEAMGLRVSRGRGLRSTDFGGPPVAVLNEPMAAFLWPAEDPLGRCLYQGEEEHTPCIRVVGVVEYAHRKRVVEEPAPQYYLPMGEDGGAAPRGLVVRVEGDPRELAAGVVRAILQELPALRYARAPADAGADGPRVPRVASREDDLHALRSPGIGRGGGGPVQLDGLRCGRRTT